MIRRLQVGDPTLARLRTAVRDDARARIAAFVTIAGILTAAALLLSPPATVTYDVGAVADRAIRAPRSVSFVSESLTEAERDKAAAAVPKQYATNPAVVATASSRIAAAITAIGRIRNDAAQNRDQKLGSLQKLNDVSITPAIAADVVDMTQPEWDQVAAGLDSPLRTLYAQGIKPEHAFYVAVGLGKTMTALDILEGRMIIEIGMAAVRPAEFIVLRFSHKMPES